MKRIILFSSFFLITVLGFGQKLGDVKTVTMQLVHIDCAGEWIGLYFNEKTSGKQYVFDWGRQQEYFDMKNKKDWEHAFAGKSPCEVPKNRYYKCILKYEIIERMIGDGDGPIRKVKDWVVVGLKKI